MKYQLYVLVLSIALTGCAANSGIAPLGADTFVVCRQSRVDRTSLTCGQNDANDMGYPEYRVGNV
jgi:hypothetical protein